MTNRHTDIALSDRMPRDAFSRVIRMWTKKINEPKNEQTKNCIKILNTSKSRREIMPCSALCRVSDFIGLHWKLLLAVFVVVAVASRFLFPFVHSLFVIIIRVADAFVAWPCLCLFLPSEFSHFYQRLPPTTFHTPLALFASLFSSAEKLFVFVSVTVESCSLFFCFPSSVRCGSVRSFFLPKDNQRARAFQLNT